MRLHLLTTVPVLSANVHSETKKLHARNVSLVHQGVSIAPNSFISKRQEFNYNLPSASTAPAVAENCRQRHREAQARYREKQVTTSLATEQNNRPACTDQQKQNHRDAQARYRKKNREYIRDAQARYREKNREYIQDAQAQYREKNREYTRDAQARHREKNREFIRLMRWVGTKKGSEFRLNMLQPVDDEDLDLQSYSECVQE